MIFGPRHATQGHAPTAPRHTSCRAAPRSDMPRHRHAEPHANPTRHGTPARRARQRHTTRRATPSHSICHATPCYAPSRPPMRHTPTRHAATRTDTQTARRATPNQAPTRPRAMPGHDMRQQPRKNTHSCATQHPPATQSRTCRCRGRRALFGLELKRLGLGHHCEKDAEEGSKHAQS